eukprot:1404635-Prorocentrum_lima.AAC.1
MYHSTAQARRHVLEHQVPKANDQADVVHTAFCNASSKAGARHQNRQNGTPQRSGPGAPLRNLDVRCT